MVDAWLISYIILHTTQNYQYEVHESSTFVDAYESEKSSFLMSTTWKLYLTVLQHAVWKHLIIA